MKSRQFTETMPQKSAVSAPERVSGSRETPLVTAVAANTAASAAAAASGMSWQQQQSFDEGRMMAAHLRGKAVAGAGGGPSNAPNAATASVSAATLPSYFAERQSAAAVATATALPPKMANGRVGQKAASSEDYGTGERNGSFGSLATDLLISTSSPLHFESMSFSGIRPGIAMRGGGRR